MRHAIAAFGGAVALGCSASAQEPDMAAIMKWSQAETARFHVEGKFEDRIPIVYDSAYASYGRGDVADAVTLDFDWNISDEDLAGPVEITNGASTVGALYSVDDGCKPPMPQGPYEHLTAAEVRDSDGPRVEIVAVRGYPNIEVAGCEADTSYKPYAAHELEVVEHLAVPNPMMLAIPGMNSGNGAVEVAEDGKSFIVRADGWTWTYTAEPLP